MTPEEKEKKEAWQKAAKDWDKIVTQLEKCLKDAREARLACIATESEAEYGGNVFRAWVRHSNRKILKAQGMLAKLKEMV